MAPKGPLIRLLSAILKILKFLIGPKLLIILSPLWSMNSHRLCSLVLLLAYYWRRFQSRYDLFFMAFTSFWWG